MRISVLSPSGTSLDHEHLRSVGALKGVDVRRTYGATVIEHARAILATAALDDGAEVLFWVDSDIVFEAADFYGLVDRLMSGPYAVLGAAYSKRSPGTGMVGSFVENPGRLKFFRPGAVEAGTLGLGFTAVRREVFESMAKTMPRVRLPAEPEGFTVWPFFYPAISGGVYYAEDAAFCFRARRAGFKIGMDLEPRIYHKGQYKYGLEDVGMAIPRADELDAEFDSPGPGHDQAKGPVGGDEGQGVADPELDDPV